jgi:uncharacterized damage-inducible protein DinB
MAFVLSAEMPVTRSNQHPDNKHTPPRYHPIVQTSAMLSALLLPELESELSRTRRTLQSVPEARGDFKSHEKSRSLASLAGHTADLVSFLPVLLNQPEFDFGSEHRTPLVMQSGEQLLAAFDESAAKAMEALKITSDESFQQDFRFLFNGRAVFSGSRYTAYRINVLDHIIHHRAQLGVYLRLLNLSVPAIYGPSADESPQY